MRHVMMEAWRYKEAFHYKNLSETQVTGVYIPNASTRYDFICYNSISILESLIILRIEKIGQVIANESK